MNDPNDPATDPVTGTQAARRNIDIQKSFHKTGRLRFKLRNAFGRRINGRNPSIERLFLGFGTDPARFQTRHALVHPDKRDARQLLQARSQQHDLARLSLAPDR